MLTACFHTRMLTLRILQERAEGKEPVDSHLWNYLQSDRLNGMLMTLFRKVGIVQVKVLVWNKIRLCATVGVFIQTEPANVNKLSYHCFAMGRNLNGNVRNNLCRNLPSWCLAMWKSVRVKSVKTKHAK